MDGVDRQRSGSQSLKPCCSLLLFQGKLTNRITPIIQFTTFSEATVPIAHEFVICFQVTCASVGCSRPSQQWILIPDSVEDSVAATLRFLTFLQPIKEQGARIKILALFCNTFYMTHISLEQLVCQNCNSCRAL